MYKRTQLWDATSGVETGVDVATTNRKQTTTTPTTPTIINIISIVQRTRTIITIIRSNIIIYSSSSSSSTITIPSSSKRPILAKPRLPPLVLVPF